jgi:hypothetical protein
LWPARPICWIIGLIEFGTLELFQAIELRHVRIVLGHRHALGRGRFQLCRQLHVIRHHVAGERLDILVGPTRQGKLRGIDLGGTRLRGGLQSAAAG